MFVSFCIIFKDFEIIFESTRLFNVFTSQLFCTHIEHVPNETISDDGDRALP